MTYLIIGHESPREYADLLIERDLIDAARQVGAVAVNDVLEVLAKADVEWLQVDLALHNLQQSIELIDSQVLDDSLGHSSDLFLSR